MARNAGSNPADCIVGSAAAIDVSFGNLLLFREREKSRLGTFVIGAGMVNRTIQNEMEDVTNY